MTEAHFERNPDTVINVVGSSAGFPVHRVFCVGRNYADHVREMGNDPKTDHPIFFMKPADALVPNGGDVTYPPMTDDVHHEVELVIALKSGGRDLDFAAALEAVFGYAVGVDLTRRDLQAKMKNKGAPWEIAKAFEQSAPIAAITPKEQCEFDENTAICLSVNGDEKQSGVLGQMIWSVAEIIQVLSQYFTLKPGDIIFTGTPAGVGPVAVGDTVDATIDGLTPLSFKMVK